MVIAGPNSAPAVEFPAERVGLGSTIKKWIHRIEGIDRRWDRRKDQRQGISCMFELTPVNLDDLSPLDDPITVVGKDISAGGLHFYHQQTMPYQYVLVAPVGPTAAKLEGSLTLLLKVRWCRFLRPGWYDSGGQFVRIVK